MKKAPINFRIDQELKNRLVELAKKEDRALSNYIHHILIKHVEEHKAK